MSELLKGQGAVWGVGGVTFTGIAISSTTGRIQSADITRDSEIEPLNDASGETVGRAYFNAKKTATVNVIPSNAGTIATARTNLDTMIPTPGSTITLADADSTITDGLHSGVYLIDSARLNRTNRSFAAVEMNLTQFDANNVAATVV